MEELKEEEWRQLRQYVLERDRGDDYGWYYGIKKVFEKRHKKILKFLEQKLREG